MKGILKEFKEFISRGNVLDMAVGIIIGSAFTSIVNSLVTDILTPIITAGTEEIDFKSLNFHGIMYGNFINAVVTFLLTSAAVFALVKFVNVFKKKEAPAPATTKECKYCKSVIAIAAVKCPCCTSDLDD